MLLVAAPTVFVLKMTAPMPSAFSPNSAWPRPPFSNSRMSMKRNNSSISDLRVMSEV